MRLTEEEKKNIEHCLKHLKENHINQNDLYGGWYCGNKPSFIKRHLKAITMLEKWLNIEDNK